MQTRKALGAMLGLLALSGCGGGSSSTNTASNRGRSATPSYAVTDLGASPYYAYLYYGPEFGLYRSNGTVSINKLGQVISDASYRASYWQNGALNYLTNGTSYDDVSGLNDLGQFVGVALASSASANAYYYPYHATLWSNAQATDLGTISGNAYDYSQAYAINNGGLIVGDSQVDTTSGGYQGTHAFLWQSSAMTDLGTLPGGSFSHASSISDSGQVVGWGDVAGTSGSSYYSGTPVHAFLWQNGSIADLGTLPGGASSDANSVNASGQIVGSSETTASPQGLYQATTLHAYIWQGGKMTDIGTLGGPSSVAFAINSSGQVVGGADTTKVDNSLNYCYPLYPGGGAWVGGAATNAPATGTGGATNGGTGSGSSTGSSTPPPPGGGFNPIGGGASGASGAGRSIGKAKSKTTRGIGDTYVAHAFVYLNGTMFDLNSTLPANSGWELVQATGISEDGRIVGYGIYNQRLHAFVLQPQ